jgi:pterin-4a-carbinolamine dehydratase
MPRSPSGSGQQVKGFRRISIPARPPGIERTFRFRDFREALTFVQKVGEVAETEGHHPDISFGWGYATVSLRTKKIKGLHENDFIMATKIDQLALPPNG